MRKIVKKVRKHTIDAVALVRQIRDAQAEQVAGMTAEQQIAFFQAKAQDLLRKLGMLRLAEGAEPAPPASARS